jgi:DUF971 family protein
MEERVQPKTIELVGDVLAILWSDGLESYWPLEQLRKACPCALCQGEPILTGLLQKPGPQAYGPRSFQLLEWRVVGSYALQLRWADGHDTGLYPFSELRRKQAGLGAPEEGEQTGPERA